MKAIGIATLFNTTVSGEKMSRFFQTICATLIVSCAASSVIAQEQKIRFAYLAVVDLLPYYIADKKGYFKELGISVEPIPMTGGPAIASAVMSGSADVGYAGTVPIISARIQGLPLKFFSGIALDQGPDHHMNIFVGSPKLGITSVKDLVGKVVAMNTQGGQCDSLCVILSPMRASHLIKLRSPIFHFRKLKPRWHSAILPPGAPLNHFSRE